MPYPFRPLSFNGGAYVVERLDAGTAEGEISVEEYLSFESLTDFRVIVGGDSFDASAVSFLYRSVSKTYGVSVLIGHGDRYLSNMPCSIAFEESLKLGEGPFVPSSFVYDRDGSSFVYKVGFHDGRKVALRKDVTVVFFIHGYSGLAPTDELSQGNVVVKI
ncbi:MAG: hypothetical protein LKG11_07425 [Bacilli bacterium]|nr:hypothetical protein [Bacilli bacterium]